MSVQARHYHYSHHSDYYCQQHPQGYQQHQQQQQQPYGQQHYQHHYQYHQHYGHNYQHQQQQHYKRDRYSHQQIYNQAYQGQPLSYHQHEHHHQQQQQQQNWHKDPKYYHHEPIQTDYHHSSQNSVVSTPPTTPTTTYASTSETPKMMDAAPVVPSSIPMDHLPPTPSSYNSDYLLQSPNSEDSAMNTQTLEHPQNKGGVCEADCGNKGDERSATEVADNQTQREEEKREESLAAIAATEKEESQESRKESIRKGRESHPWRSEKDGEAYGCEMLDTAMGDALNEMMVALGGGDKDRRRRVKQDGGVSKKGGESNEKGSSQDDENISGRERLLTPEELSLRIRDEVLRNLQNMLAAKKQGKVKIKLSMQIDDGFTKDLNVNATVSGQTVSATQVSETEFQYKCLQCPFSVPLQDSSINKIIEHIAIGFPPNHQDDTKMPLLLRSFWQRVKMSVNLFGKTVSTSTVLVCKNCRDNVEFRTARDAQAHHSEVHCREQNGKFACFTCDRSISRNEKNKHLENCGVQNGARLQALLAYGCSNQLKQPQSRQCKSCQEDFTQHPALPNWMRMQHCLSCFDDIISDNNNDCLKAVLCSLCHEGRHGINYGKSLSVCCECEDFVRSAKFLSDGGEGRKECAKYAEGMLKQLMAQLQKDSRKESSISKATNKNMEKPIQDRDASAKTKKVAVVPPEPRRAKKRKTSTEENNNNNNDDKKLVNTNNHLITKATRKMIF